MKNFEFQRPETIEDALKAIDGMGERCKIVAGGTNLVPNLRSGALRPELVIDLGGIEQLKKIELDGETVKIGAMATFAEIIGSSVIKERASILWEAASHIAGPLVRNRATLGGNLVDASPAADSAVPLLALDVEVTLLGNSGERAVSLGEFFLGYRKVDLKPGELLTGVSFKAPADNISQAFYKLGRRGAMAISVVSAGVLLEANQAGCLRARIALGAVAPTPIRALAAEQVLVGSQIDAKLADSAGELASAATDPVSDIRATADYRSKVCGVLVRRLVMKCAGIGA